MIPGIGSIGGLFKQKTTPFVVSVGTPSLGNAGKATPGQPAGAKVGDVYILWQKATNNDGAPIPTPPSSFTKLINTSVVNTVSYMSLSWKIVTVDDEPIPTDFVDQGNSNHACFVLVRGCSTSPVDNTTSTVDNSVDTTATCNAFTTTEDKQLILFFFSGTQSGVFPLVSCSGYTNSSLADITELTDTAVEYTQLSIVSATKEVAGSVSATTGTWNKSAIEGNLSIALKGL
jgi:hypothetical protein